MKRFEVCFNIDVANDENVETVATFLREGINSVLNHSQGERLGIVDVRELGTVQE